MANISNFTSDPYSIALCGVAKSYGCEPMWVTNILLVVSVLTVVFNAGHLFAILKCPPLRTRANEGLLHLAAADLLFGES